MVDPKPTLDDPACAAFAWKRYRRMLRRMSLIALTNILLLPGIVGWSSGPLPLHLVIATVPGIGFMVMPTAALMELLFLSSGAGHDAQMKDLPKEEMNPDD